MKITVNDTQNSANTLYYQSLCLLFLPCEKFNVIDDPNELLVNAFENQNTLCAHVKIKVGERVAFAHDEAKQNHFEKRNMKNLIGRTILKAFYDIFGLKAPWGISTGVKPVKLAREYINAYGEEKARDILVNEYAFDLRKANLCIEASRHEDKMLSRIKGEPCSLYVSVPFCPTRCDYCSFVSYTTPRLLDLIPQYLEKLKSDIKTACDTMKGLNLTLQSVYIGGGTPSVLDERQIEGLLSCINQSIGSFKDYEFTFEAGRPDCITKEKLQVLCDFNVGRISINTQTTNDSVLKNVGRNHTYSQFVRCFEQARNIGFDCINTDLIAGLPGDNLQSFCKSVDDVSSLNPENITVHSFTLKKSSKFRVQGQTDITQSCTEAYNMLNYGADTLKDLGYSPYYVYRQKNTVGNLDNTGYAKEGHESLYNLVMMGEHHTVLAVGAGAVTKLVPQGKGSIERIFSPKYPYEYLDQTKYRIFDAKSVIEFYEKQQRVE